MKQKKNMLLLDLVSKVFTVFGLNCFIYLAYQISIKNWAGLLEILVILSNLFAFLKYKKSPRNDISAD